MKWNETSSVLPNNGERVMGIYPKSYLKSERISIFTFEVEEYGGLVFEKFIDGYGNCRNCDDIKYWALIDNIPNDVEL